MPLIAILLDAIAFGSYRLQAQSAALYHLGLVGQSVIVLALLIMTITYKGKKLGWFNFATWTHNFTIRYAVIVLSLIVNALVLFLYILNLTGTNTLIFR
ncbi:hypothetical protein [Lacticaseibacillus camelliae]|uniref:Uncharacterized protein n=1 Tax=Lacticaseibacillus camelliae DSM 22697 = JCM 13995 TaxID=1423730 RepID=A0A0R2FB44_9LACO|nr:hypothetical protein [Lacticaseibacillus camelliae]KRN25609.1 hypothetical protein FC75_GL000146 [Lacticaseibacillus camelliae DSM 22697 = JCM 13995]